MPDCKSRREWTREDILAWFAETDPASGVRRAHAREFHASASWGQPLTIYTSGSCYISPDSRHAFGHDGTSPTDEDFRLAAEWVAERRGERTPWLPDPPATIEECKRWIEEAGWEWSEYSPPNSAPVNLRDGRTLRGRSFGDANRHGALADWQAAASYAKENPRTGDTR